MYFATAIIILITILNIIFYYLRKHQEEDYSESNDSAKLLSDQVCRRFSLAEIRSMTQDFDEALVIGRGGFGKVYKGNIDNGARLVAIKRLDMGSKQGAPEFQTEIKMLSKFRHSHLVSLIGYCNAFQEMIIVYEYMPGGTLAERLYKIGRSNGDTSSRLSWEQRLKICIGAARGIEYLHTGTGVQERVIHRDVKSSNILLDENWAAKISDFGLSKIGPANQPCTHVSTNVKGTFGYLDPEYSLTRRLTRKSDVYAFGVVLFEVLCGRPAVDITLDEEQWGLAGWAKQCIQEGRVHQIVDPSLSGSILENCLSVFTEIALQCLHNSSKRRPTMAEVVTKLDYALALQETIDFPEVNPDIFSNGRDYDNQELTDSGTNLEVNKAGRVGDNDEQNDEIRQLDGAHNRKSDTKRAKRMTWVKRLRFLLSSRPQVALSGEVQVSFQDQEMAITYSRYEKVKKILERFDMNKDGGLNRDEIIALVAGVNPRIKFTDEQMTAILNEIFRTYSEFIDDDKGLTYDGLLRSYEDGAGDVNRDFDALGLEL